MTPTSAQQLLSRESEGSETSHQTVFSNKRDTTQPKINLPKGMKLNTRIQHEGVSFLKRIPECFAPVAFLDPQYRGVLDHLNYGNEGKSRGAARSSLPQMTDIIPDFIAEIDRILIPSGHLFLWIDKFHLCTGFSEWTERTSLQIVDMVTWSKKRMGMGYRTRRVSEYLIILQKMPRRAKGVWTIHNIPDVWEEKVPVQKGIHPKPVMLQSKLIQAVSNESDIVIDPAAGSFSVLEACKISNRNFLGCDING